MPPTGAGATHNEESEPTVLFLHIGKTAGLTLRKILRRQFPPSRIMVLKGEPLGSGRLRREDTIRTLAILPESERARPRLIMGHMVFGVHEFVPRPSTYITLLRNPVSLTVSQYNYVLRTPGHPLHRTAISRYRTLDDYVRSGVSLETDNSQTRALAGDTTTPFGECTSRLLDLAKENVEKHFAVVGLAERFDESLIVLRKAFGWTKLYYVRVNVAPGHYRKDGVPATTLEAIAERNWLDMELYKWAAERFEERVASDASFEPALQRFRLENRVYAPWGHVRYTLPRRLRARFGRQDPPFDLSNA